MQKAGHSPLVSMAKTGLLCLGGASVSLGCPCLSTELSGPLDLVLEEPPGSCALYCTHPVSLEVLAAQLSSRMGCEHQECGLGPRERLTIPPSWCSLGSP